jgi:hypothetical protein
MSLADKTEPSSVALRFPIVIGTPALLSARQGPDLYFRGQTLKTNAPRHGFAFVNSLKAGNLDLLCGGMVDVVALVDAPLDIPTLSPGNSVVFEGSYTGLVPEGMKAGDAFELVVEVVGIGKTMEDADWPAATPSTSPDASDRTEECLRKIEPNRNSKVKIEKYAFGMEFEIELGKPCRLEGMSSPDTTFRISSVIANIPCPSFARVDDLRVANLTFVCVGGPTGTHVISLIEKLASKDSKEAKAIKVSASHVEGLPTVVSKSGAIDLWNLREKDLLDVPTLTPANSVRFSGYYDGKVPVGYEKGETFRLSIMFAGYASIGA